jgi:outer membrane efflux protein
MNGLLQDLRYVVRQLRTSPGFAATAVLSLILGIGATTAIFRVVYSILLDPDPHPGCRPHGACGTARQGRPGSGDPGNTTTVPTDLSGAWHNAFNHSSPDYFVGLNLNIPFRKRVAKADQYRSELEYRRASLRKKQLKKQIRIEVRNAPYALEGSRARVESAREARDLAEGTFEITKKEQDLRAGSSYQTMTAQRDLSVAELDLVNAMTTYQKAIVELDRATGATLEHNGVLIQDAVSGTVAASSP